MRDEYAMKQLTLALPTCGEAYCFAYYLLNPLNTALMPCFVSIANTHK